MEGENPVAVIAYANTGAAHEQLQCLEEEAKAIQRAFDRVQHMEVRLVPAATIEELFAVLEEKKYRDRVRILHFAGHANGRGLMFQTAEEGAGSADPGKLANMEGLARVLKQQANLQLVFLNGCSSKDQVLDLSEQGIPVTIATLRDINDKAALTVARGFYEALVQEKSLQEAFESAEGKVLTGEASGGFRGAFVEDHEPERADQQPWKIYGPTKERAWTLAKAATKRPPKPYLPEEEFEADVFICYTQVDNEETRYESGELAWVNCLKEDLEKEVKRSGIGRRLHIRMAKRGAEPSETNEDAPDEAVARAAILVAVESPSFVVSPRCKSETTSFVEKAATDNRFQGRVFAVRSRPVPPEERPPALHGAEPFSFHEHDRPRELSPLSRDYQDALIGLAHKIADQLKNMRETIETGAPAADTRPAVFLAEGTEDLMPERTRLETFIGELGYRVVPSTRLGSDPEEFRQVAEADLAADCKLFVQWLGPESTRTRDFSGYEELQLELAQANGTDMLRAYQSDSIDFDYVMPAHRGFLDADHVMAMDLAVFKIRIEETLSRIKEKEDLAARPKESDTAESPVTGEPAGTILINACGSDRDEAFKIRNRLAATHNYGFEIVEDEEMFDKLTKFYEFAGLVVVFGDDASDEWVANRMRQCGFYRLEKAPQAPACAVYLDPKENGKRLLSEPPFFRKIEGDKDEADLTAFLAELEA